MESEPAPSTYRSQQSVLHAEGTNKIAEMKRQFLLIKESPEDVVAQQNFEQGRSLIEHIFSKLHFLLGNISQSIERINTDAYPVNSLLLDERRKHRELSKKMRLVESGVHTSEDLIDDSQTLYNWKYARNWAIFIGIIGLLFVISITVRTANKT
jgi:hypothetical protein